MRMTKGERNATAHERAEHESRQWLWLHAVMLVKMLALLTMLSVGQAQHSAIDIGSFQLTVPEGSTVQHFDNGVIQLSYVYAGITITAQIQAQQDLSPGDDQLPHTMQAWSSGAPMQPIGDAWSITGLDNLSGFIKGYSYEQPYQDMAGPNILHGFFILVTQKTGDGLVIDVFSSGPAHGAQDWQVLSDYATTILNHISQRR